MIIYNVTVKVDKQIAPDWLRWLKEEHIPEMINTGCFTRAQVMELLETDDSEGPTYAIQYFSESKALYNRYLATHAATMRKKGYDLWGERFIAFRTLMQIVH